MILLFWQNCVSPHQLPYIKELYNDYRVSKVYIIAPVWQLTERKMMGWENDNDINGFEVIISPSKKKVEQLFFENQGKTIHIFSGIHADKFVFQWFLKSLEYDIKRGLITEPPFLYKKPIIFHKLRFLLFDFRYISKIDYVFGMGAKAVEYYKYWTKSWKVFLFGYCVDNLVSPERTREYKDLRFVYIGSLIKRKNVYLVLKSFKTLTKNKSFSFDIIGDGPEYDKLLNYINKHKLSEEISLKGKLLMKEVHDKLSDYDVLILPSSHDGWGAVINEALHNGLYVITSDNCGAKTLIENSNRGIIFKNNKCHSLSKALNYSLENSSEIKKGKAERIRWSEKIKGLSMAKYMVDCLSENETIIPPWQN